MKWFSNLKISVRLVITFAVILCGLLGVSVFGSISMTTLVHEDENMYNVNLMGVSLMGDAVQDYYALRVTVLKTVYENFTNAGADTLAAAFDTAKKGIEKTELDYINSAVDPVDIANYNKLKADFEAYFDGASKIIVAVRANDKNTADTEMVSLGNTAKTVSNQLELMQVYNNNQGATQSKNNTAQGNMTTTIMIVIAVVVFLLALMLAFLVINSLTKPIKKLMEGSIGLAKGDLNVSLGIHTKDEVGMLIKCFDKVVENLKMLISEMNHMSEQHNLGDIDVMVPEDKFEGAYREMAAGVNSMVAGHISVKKKAMACIAEFSRGNFEAPLEQFPGKKAFINDNIELLRKNLKALMVDANILVDAAIEGKLGTRADASRHEGDFRKIVDGVNKTLDAVIGPLNVACNYVERISKGDIPEKITDNYNGDFSVVKNNLNTCIDAVNKLVTDANMLVDAAIGGRLSTRADASRHEGDFRRIVDGVNKTLDAVIEPINEAAAVLNEMSRGNLSVNVVGEYKGDHAAIKNAMNDTINTLKGYVGEISDVLTKLAAGDLNVEIDNDYRGEFVQIKNSINNIVISLNGVLGEINIATEQVATGTQQVSAGSQTLSQGATEQASSIEELNASLSEIASQTKQNAENAIMANTLAVTAREDAAGGNVQMQEMQQAMAAINETSEGISKIIKVIDDIAFQTNLLALNAAVEAARAGQHGKGFAVVAEEVRSLAQRSAAAAKETTEMIEESVKKVRDGTKIADATAQALVKIVKGVEKATDLVGGIAKACSDQATAVAQVNKGIEQVSQVVTTNSATAEESAAASEELTSQTVLLKEMVSKFKLKGRSEAATFSKPTGNPKSTIFEGKVTQKAQPKIALNDREFGKY